jgi:hypothetical protein
MKLPKSGVPANVVYHYTTGQNFHRIVGMGAILPAVDYVPLGEKPIVWFSYDPLWEPTACKSLRDNSGSIIHLDREGTAQHGGGLVRIGVHPRTAPHDWHTLKELSGMSSKIARALYRTAIEKGSRPGNWRGTFDPVPRSNWTSVDVFHNGLWVPVPLTGSAEAAPLERE